MWPSVALILATLLLCWSTSEEVVNPVNEVRWHIHVVDIDNPSCCWTVLKVELRLMIGMLFEG